MKLALEIAVGWLWLSVGVSLVVGHIIAWGAR